ncbi:MAG: hypothetical protein IT430_10270 [Phycisphaerales bacterium]|nr:hypothetical protein [Phycisphaerales bacterium]
MPALRSRGRFRWATTLIAIGCFLTAPSTAPAGFDDSAEPVEIRQSDVDLIARHVRLDGGQRELVQALFTGYSLQYRAAAEAHRSRRDSLFNQAAEEPDHRRQIQVEWRAMHEQWRTTRQRLNSEFFDSIQALLTRDQLDRWPLVERDQRRRLLLQATPRFFAENVDLFDVVEQLDLPAESRELVDAPLNRWADELDALLQARREAQDQWEQIQKRRSSAQLAADDELVRSARDRLDHACQSIRNLNVRVAELISTQLPPPAGSDFRAAFNLAAYPTIYRLSAAAGYIDKALQLPDLTSEQRSAIETIGREYASEVLLINDQLAVLLRRQEDADPQMAALKRNAFEQPGGVKIDAEGNAIIGNLNGVASMSFTTGPMPGGRERPRVIVPGLDRAEPDSPQGKLEVAKRDLIQQTIDSVFATLSASQQTALPKPTAEQMLSPEEHMRRVMEKAFAGAAITHHDDGSVTFKITIEDQ